MSWGLHNSVAEDFVCLGYDSMPPCSWIQVFWDKDLSRSARFEMFKKFLGHFKPWILGLAMPGFITLWCSIIFQKNRILKLLQLPRFAFSENSVIWKIALIWDGKQCSLVQFYQLFEGTYCLHLQGWSSETSQSSKKIGSSSSGIQNIKSQQAVLITVIVSEQEI